MRPQAVVSYEFSSPARDMAKLLLHILIVIADLYVAKRRLGTGTTVRARERTIFTGTRSYRAHSYGDSV
jgi:hypothetical protein